MCLGVPAKIVSIRGNTAVVDIWGISREVRLDALDVRVAPGDFIIEHAGFAARRIPPADVADTLALYEALLTEEGEYPCGSHVDEELESEVEDLVLA